MAVGIARAFSALENRALPELVQFYLLTINFVTLSKNLLKKKINIYIISNNICVAKNKWTEMKVESKQ